MLKLSVMDILLLWHLCINSLFHLLTSICLSFSPSNHQPQNVVSADEKLELISDFSQSFSLTELYCRCSVRTYLQHRNKVKQNSVTKRKRKVKEKKKKRKRKKKNIQLRFLSFVVDPIECMRSHLSFFLVDDDVLVRKLENC
jgi:hypothetical protein